MRFFDRNPFLLVAIYFLAPLLISELVSSMGIPINLSSVSEKIGIYRFLFPGYSAASALACVLYLLFSPLIFLYMARVATLRNDVNLSQALQLVGFSALLAGLFLLIIFAGLPENSKHTPSRAVKFLLFFKANNVSFSCLFSVLIFGLSVNLYFLFYLLSRCFKKGANNQ